MSIRNQVMGAAGAASGSVNYIEDVFSTYLYTGNGATQTINNGIDLAGKGGLVWTKPRSIASGHLLYDTVRGAGNYLNSATTTASQFGVNTLQSFNSSGFTLGEDDNSNGSGRSSVSWTFREQPKFFDVVTYTGDGVDGRTVAHSLGVVPGCIIIKQTNAANNWYVYHRSFNGGVTPHLYRTFLNLQTANPGPDSGFLPSAPTSTVISLGINGAVNASGATYVAYIFAHNAGGFGLTGTDNVISCSSFTCDGSGNATVNLGYEPQWVMIKNITRGTTNWHLNDNMRGMPTSGQSRDLKSNTSDSETGDNLPNPTATGFTVASVVDNGGADTYIYIAIRRGPMKVPTDGTKVFSPVANAGTGATKTVTTNFPVDLTIDSSRGAATHVFTDRLRGGGIGASPRLYSQFTDAETNVPAGYGLLFDSNTGFTLVNNTQNGSGDNYIYYGMQRAPGFFDEVCYTGTGTFTTPFAHNLTVTPELVIVKARTTTGQMNWYVCQYGVNKYGQLTTAAFNPDLSTYAPVTSTTFVPILDISGANYVTYLFATCPGVSKVGSYTGNGTTQTIPCGFAAGARFVLIKRTDSTGAWYVWDSARGIVAGNDPHLSLNTTVAEVTTDDSLDPVSSGFTVNQLAATNINVSGATYIFLAIA